MANICTSDYRIVGETAELDKLYSLMKEIEQTAEESHYLVGVIIKALNGDSIPDNLYVKGDWSNLERQEDCISFHQESSWETLYQAWDFICSKFDGLTAYFIGEEPGFDVFVKRENTEKGWFTDNYQLDAYSPDDEYCTEYFCSLQDALSFINKKFNKELKQEEDIWALNTEWFESDHYIFLNEFCEV